MYTSQRIQTHPAGDIRGIRQNERLLLLNSGPSPSLYTCFELRYHIIVFVLWSFRSEVHDKGCIDP